MRHVITFGFGILLVLAVAAGVGPFAMARSLGTMEGSLGSLGGYVREGDPDLGMEIEGATVFLSNGLVALTNGRGYFEFQGIPAGDYVISVEAECYEPNAVGAHVEPDTLNLQNVALEPVPDCVPGEGGCGGSARWTGEGAGDPWPAAGALLLAGMLGLGIRRARRRSGPTTRFRRAEKATTARG